MEILAITTTVGSEADAQALARGLIERRLAACVQVEAGLQSFYRWQGRQCEDAEWRLTVKTLPRKRADVEAFLAERHPYDVPQLLVTRMEAGAAYGAWVAESVG